MAIAILSAKSFLAATLLVAAGGKLADLSGFAATLRLFIPGRPPSKFVRWTATLIALGELLAGATSMALPGLRWINYVVLAVCVGFVTISTVGYALFRGRACQ